MGLGRSAELRLRVARRPIDLFVRRRPRAAGHMDVGRGAGCGRALYENYKKSGAIVVEPPANYPWGSREMLVGDPDGHRLRLASDATPADHPQLNVEVG